MVAREHKPSTSSTFFFDSHCCVFIKRLLPSDKGVITLAGVFWGENNTETDTSSQPNNEAHCQAAGLSTLDFLGNRGVRGDSAMEPLGI